MTSSGVIPPPEERLMCKCGQPIKPCTVTLGPGLSMLCRGYVHKNTAQHTCPGQVGSLAEPAEATMPP